jgi:hypothetical protein
VTRLPGHPDQFPYIDIWQTLAAHPPWLKKCFKDNYKNMMTRATNTGTLKRKPKNMNKVTEILQKSEESTAQFCERVGKAYYLYFPFHPKAPKYQRMINATFVGEIQGDIRKKLQKLEGFAGMNASQPLKVATKVFVNRDQEAQKKVEKK